MSVDFRFLQYVYRYGYIISLAVHGLLFGFFVSQGMTVASHGMMLVLGVWIGGRRW